MCEGGVLVADFVAGTESRPDVPAGLDEHLTVTTDGRWVVWAYKVARRDGEMFRPLGLGAAYPADARAGCRRNRPHRAPDPGCSCGFHALSSRELPGLPVSGRFTALTVALSGRVLAFEWLGGWAGDRIGNGFLWRAGRQTVIQASEPGRLDPSGQLDRAARRPRLRRPDDPDGRLAARAGATPRDSGPVRLPLPASVPTLPVSDDDAGWCLAASGGGPGQQARAALVLV